jgi:hypothetical protein
MRWKRSRATPRSQCRLAAQVQFGSAFGETTSMRVGKPARAVADAQVTAAAYNVANLCSQSPRPLYMLGRILVIAGDALQSLPSTSSPARQLHTATSPASAVPRPLRTR